MSLIITSGLGATGSAAAPTYTASLVGAQVKITFDLPVVDTTDLRDPTSYTFTAPAGAALPIVTSVAILSNTEVLLTISTELVQGGSYTVTLAAQATQSLNVIEGNVATPAGFSGTGVLPTAVSATPLNSTTVRVVFSEAVRQVSAVNADDALNPANYSIPFLTVTSVQSENAETVRLLTSTQVPSTLYTITIANIKDLAGNTIA